MGEGGDREEAPSPLAVAAGALGFALAGLMGILVMIMKYGGSGGSSIFDWLWTQPGNWAFAILAVPGVLGLLALLQASFSRRHAQGLAWAVMGIVASGILILVWLVILAMGAAIAASVAGTGQ